MAIKEIFEKTQPRENNGQKTFRLYEFQIYFGISILLEKQKNKEDYCLLMDYLDDVVIMDNKDNPSYITFYQVKTNEKEEISLSTIINKEYLSKMCYNLNSFVEENSKAIFVTNSAIPFNLGNRKSKIYVKDFKDITFLDIKPVSISKILENNDKKEEAIEKIKEISGCSFNPDDVYLLKTDFSIDDFEDSIMGKLMNYLEKENSLFDVASIKALMTELHDVLRKLQGCKYNTKVLSYNDIIKNKAFTSEQFIKIEQDLKNKQIPLDFNKVFDFAKNNLSYIFNGDNIVSIKNNYNDFTINAAQNSTIYEYILDKLNIFDPKGIGKDELIYEIHKYLLRDPLIKNSEFYKNYYEYIIVVFIYKI